MKINLGIAACLLFTLTPCCLHSQSQGAKRAPAVLHPGEPWFDTNGHRINAHGGGVYRFHGIFYWYGEHKIPGKSEKDGADGGIHAYSSLDLVHWKDEGIVFSVDYEHPHSDISYGCILERPKVMYDEATRKYIAYFKLYPPGTGYLHGFLGMATSDSPSGPFTYKGKALGGNPEFGTGDFAIFRDRDGNSYHLAVRKPDRVFVAGKLTAQGEPAPAKDYCVAEGIDNATEAPVLIRHGNIYFLLGSGSTGFEPNPARSFAARSICGPYRSLGNFVSGTNPHNGLGPEKTFGGQLSFAIPMPGRSDVFIAMFDIWNPTENAKATYIWLPLTFENGRPVVHWVDAWNPGEYLHGAP